MARGSRTDNDVREEIAALFARGVKGVTPILTELRRVPEFERRLPSERTVSRITQQMKVRYPAEQQELDRPWQIRLAQPGDQLPAEADALPILLKCHREAAIFRGSGNFSIRMARWVSRLHPVLGDDVPRLLNIGYLYANRERWAIINDSTLDTTDLDHLVSFAPWSSPDAARLYRAAVEGGNIPGMEFKRTYRDMSFAVATHDDGVGHRETESEFAFDFRHLQATLPGLDMFRSVPENRRDEFIVRATSIIKRSERASKSWEDVTEDFMDPTLQELESLAAALREESLDAD